MAEERELAGPVTDPERIMALDTTRGVALLGILLMNITGMGLPADDLGDTGAFGGEFGASYWAWFTTSTFFAGTMRGLFSILFGAGVLLLLARLEARGTGMAAGDIYYRRTIGLLLLGLFNGLILMWPGDILYDYAVVALFLFPLRKMGARWLVLLFLAAFLFQNAGIWLDYRSAQAPEAEPKIVLSLDRDTAPAPGWSALLPFRPDTGPVPEDAEEDGADVTVFRDTVRHDTVWQAILWRAADAGHRYGRSLWATPHIDALMGMLLGMVLFRSGILTFEASRRTYLLLLAVGYGIGLPVSLWETYVMTAGQFSYAATETAGLTYDVGRLLLSLGHLAAIMLICRSGALPWFRVAMAAVGRMALTNYLLHSAMAAYVFFGFGLGYYGKLQRYELYYVVVLFWVVNIVLSLLWLKLFRFGPAEWLWRSFTYWRWQPALKRP